MGAAEIRAGKAYVEATVKDGTKAGLDAIEARVRKVGEALTSIGTKMVAAGLAIGAAFIPAIKAASELEETVNKFNVVFGNQTAAAKQWADAFSAEVGRSKQQVLDFMASTQGLIVPLGFDRAEAREISQTLTRLAVDLASFNNATDEDALAALKSGLLGEAEPMKKFGVIVNDTAVKLELLNRQINPATATDAEKTYARLAIIMRSTTDAQGDATRSAGSFANMWKRLSGEATDAAAAIGAAVLPAITGFVTQAAAAAKAMGEWASRNQSTIQFVLKIGAALTALGGTILIFGTLATATAALIPVFKGVAAAIGLMKAASLAFLATPLGIALAALAGLAASVAYAFMTQGRAMEEVSDKAEQMTAANDKARQSHQAAIERLEQLNQKTSLNNEEQSEAARLIQTLNESYGVLGVSIDAVTGKITGLSEAQQALNAAMQAAAIADVQAQLAENDRNLDVLREQQSAGWLRYGADTVTNTVTWGNGTDLVGDHIRGKGEDLMVQMRKREALLLRLKALQQNEQSALTGNPTAAADDSAEGIRQRIQKSDEAAKEEQRWDRQAHELRLSMIEDEYNRDIALINNRYDLERQRLEEIGADTLKMEEARQIELDKAYAKSQKRLADERKAKEEQAKREREEAERAAKDETQRRRDAWQMWMDMRASALETEADALQRSGDKEGATARRDEAKRVREQREDYDLEQRMDDLRLSDKQRETLRELRRRQRDAEAQQAVPEKVFSSMGTFNSAAIQSLQGNPVQSRIAKATEETAKNTKQMAKQTARFS